MRTITLEILSLTCARCSATADVKPLALKRGRGANEVADSDGEYWCPAGIPMPPGWSVAPNDQEQRMCGACSSVLQQQIADLIAGRPPTALSGPVVASKPIPTPPANAAPVRPSFTSTPAARITSTPAPAPAASGAVRITTRPNEVRPLAPMANAVVPNNPQPAAAPVAAPIPSVVEPHKLVS